MDRDSKEHPEISMLCDSHVKQGGDLVFEPIDIALIEYNLTGIQSVILKKIQEKIALGDYEDCIDNVNWDSYVRVVVDGLPDLWDSKTKLKKDIDKFISVPIKLPICRNGGISDVHTVFFKAVVFNPDGTIEFHIIPHFEKILVRLTTESFKH